QQSNPDATNLSQSLFSLVEADYVARPPGLSEGTYRVWFRTDNSGVGHKNGVGISLDQKLSHEVTLFGRFGSAEAEVNPVTDAKHDKYSSFGVQIQNGLVFNPLDTWGVGYAEARLANDDLERIGEGYYNIRLSEKLRLSFHLAHVFESPAPRVSSARFLIP